MTGLDSSQRQRVNTEFTEVVDFRGSEAKLRD